MRSSSSPASATLRFRCGWPSCSSRRVCRPGYSRWCTATRKPSTRSSITPTSRRWASSAAPTSRSTSTRRAAATGKRAQCFGGAKNHMIVMPDADLDQAVDALIGAGYGSAGERCMAISVAVPVGEQTADRLRARLIERINGLRVGHSLDPKADYGPLVTEAALTRVRDYIGQGVDAGAETGHRRPRARQRRPDFRGRQPRRRLLHRPHPVRPRHRRHVDLHRRDLRTGAVHRPRP